MLTSPANPKIKQIRKLRDRKTRSETGLFYMEGLRIVGEAFEQGIQMEYLVVAPDLLVSSYGQELANLQQTQGVPVLEVSADTFNSFALKDGPQGIGAVARQRWASLPKTRPAHGQLWIALDSVADPGNLGTILRTSDAVGAQGVILLDQCTDPYDPSAARASMGALFSQKLIKTSFAEFSAWKKQVALPLLGTSGGSDQDYHTFVYPDPCIVLMGSERQGLLPQHLALCDAVLRIPMTGRSDSLNLAVATAVVLYEIYNHRRDKEKRL
ncbi:MAG TPA: RNA methyltransferase [Anaerolineaceae bacterium]|nr:RNA methyltransferase [Anaerolineaceae bacterium]HPN51052.1 RNA methyltransferase [Anaerolineaceae bacterium]